MEWLVFAIIGIILIALVLALIPYRRRQQSEYRKTGQRPKGYYMSQGIALGLVLGLPLGLAIDNIALGPAMGLPIGLGIGAALEKRHEDELRPRTEGEQKMERWYLAGLVGLVIAGVIAFVAIAYLGFG